MSGKKSAPATPHLPSADGLAPLIMVPLELQRRIVNGAFVDKDVTLLIWLCAAYF
jgi:hypothetical protein